ncbi:MAG TPA: sulfatase-like hydrolase/transferase [Pirellulales bacterium]|jgi:arylsulfatase A-like enzyme|nr:sulfatase-like hydrolase/transferase [Pirellulales bacterium]
MIETVPLILALSLAGVAPDGLRPNILFIVVDNVGYGDLGCYGNTFNRTPRIDRLAVEGTRLTQFYCGSPTCTASRGALLTGRHPLRNGLNWQLKPEEQLGMGLPLDERMIPASLKPLGYATGAFGKWNIGFGPGGRPTERGFDEFLGHASGNIDYYDHQYNGRLDTYRGTENVRLEGYSTDLFAEAAIDFIRRHAAGPWFVYLPFNAAHLPNERNTPSGGKTEWQVPAKYLEQYGWSAAEPDRKRRYAAVLTALDDAIGRVLDTVDALDQRDRTFVFLMSDNGGGHDLRTAGDVSNNGPLRGGITQCYEGGIRVPATARWPGKIPERSTNDALLWSMDLLPTFVSAANGEVPSDRVFDGINILPILAGGEAPQRDLFWEFRKYAAVRSGDWKLVRSQPEGDWELYDLKTDVGEQHNVASQHPEVVKDLAKRFNTWRAQTARGES